MRSIPDYWWADEVVVEPHLGDGAHGPVHGPPVTLRGQLEQARKVTAGTDGTDIASETVFRAPPDAAAVLTEQARVTLPHGVPPAVARVAAVRRHAALGRLVYLEAVLE